MSSRNVYFDEKIYDYILENSLRDMPILEKLREETIKMPEGVFKENELWNGIEYDKEGKKIRTVHLGV